MNKIRQVNLSDIPALQELYQHTVLTVNRKDYTAEEVADWASCGDDTSHWNELFEEQHYVVAENEQGVATSLYKHLEAYARERGAKRLTSEVSITAKPFFEKQGFQVDEEQKRKANQMCLTNYKMSKQLC